LGLFCGLSLGYFERKTSGQQRSFIQIAIWSLAVCAELYIELGFSLKRKKRSIIGCTVLVVHFITIYFLRGYFPLPALAIVIGVFAEILILAVVYLRLCQSFDPNGPYGLSEAERKVREVHLPRL
jgi:hypothetical protein